MSGPSQTIRRGTTLSVLARPETPGIPVPDPDPAGKFLEGVVGNLGDLRLYSAIDVTEGSEPRLVLETNVARRYTVTLPAGDGPYEIWACAEMPAPGSAGHFLRLREREEVLAQALQTQRLAWHQDGMDSGWIGLPVAIARDERELDAELGARAADALRRLFFTVERICASLDDRDAARRRRREMHRPPVHRRQHPAHLPSDFAV